MNLPVFRACAVIQTLAMLLFAQPSFAQTAPQPSAASPPAIQSPAAAIPAAPAPEANPAAPRALKAETAALRELSPWSMFLNADILVKAVMIGLAFASLVTWTIFIAKMIELAVARRKLKTALARIADS